MVLARLRAFVEECRKEIARQRPTPAPSGRQVVAVVDENEPTSVPVATFRTAEAAEQFRRRLASEGISSVTWPPDDVGVAVGVPVEQDELATEYLTEWYGVPPGFPKDEHCPHCELCAAERHGGPGGEWRCLACGHVWGKNG